MENGKKIMEIDIGDSVVCDDCNDEYRGKPDTGGILVMSKAICPKCAPRWLALLEHHGEMHLLRSRCTPGMSFHDWVMALRGGNNKMTLTSFDNIEDMLKGGGA